MFSAERLQSFILLILLLSVFTSSVVVQVHAAPSPWSIETVFSSGIVGGYTSLAVDSSDYPHISYYDGSNKDLRYAQWTGSTWSHSIVDSGGVGGDVGSHTSLALDSSDNPHISYLDFKNNALMYARWMGSYWSITTLVVGGVGGHTSLALDSSDYPHISYYDFSNGDLKYVGWTGSAWVYSTVDSGGDVGEYTSLALDSSDNPHISYYDDSNDDLKYARYTGTLWEKFTVDSFGIVGKHTSLALDWLDRPHISYADDSNGALKYAWWTEVEWDISFLDVGVSVGWYTSLVLKFNVNPHISYYDDSNGALKYVGWTGSTWVYETIDSIGDVGKFTSLALSGDGNAHISYYDDSNDDLKYTRTPDEYFSDVDVVPVDVSGDGFNDAVEVAMNVDTSYSGTLMVNVHALLIPNQSPGGIIVPETSDWSITGTAVDYHSLTLYTEPGSTPGWYNIKITLFDSDDNIEDAWETPTDIYLYPPDMRELTIEIEGSGITDPTAGSYWSENDAVINVEAIPDTGWTLSNWLLDGANAGQDNPREVLMDANHVLRAVFMEILSATVDSCSPSGTPQDSFEVGETLYVTGTGYTPSTSYPIYVVVDATWTDGMAIPSRVPSTATLIPSDSEGTIMPTNVWIDPQTQGQYDIIVDVNGNGVYDAGVDALDDSDIEVTAGVEVIPEFPVAMLVPILAGISFIAVVVKKRIMQN